MRVLLGENFNVASNIPSFMKGLSERLTISIESAEIFVPDINAKLGDHPWEIFVMFITFGE